MVGTLDLLGLNIMGQSLLSWLLCCVLREQPRCFWCRVRSLISSSLWCHITRCTTRTSSVESKHHWHCWSHPHVSWSVDTVEWQCHSSAWLDARKFAVDSERGSAVQQAAVVWHIVLGDVSRHRPVCDWSRAQCRCLLSRQRGSHQRRCRLQWWGLCTAKLHSQATNTIVTATIIWQHFQRERYDRYTVFEALWFKIFWRAIFV